MKYIKKQLEKYGMIEYIKFDHEKSVSLYCIEYKDEIIYESVFGKINNKEVDLAIDHFLNKIRKEKLNRINKI